MAKAMGFDERGARRVVQAVRRIESLASDLTGDQFGGRRGVAPPIWAELTGEDTSSGGITGSYSWKMVMPQDGSFVDHSSGYTSGDSYSAIEANGVTGLASGTVVQVWFAGFLAGGEPFYVFVAGGAERLGDLFAVALTKDGGTDGDNSNAATYTYTVEDLDENELGTAMSPAWARPVGSMTPATHGTGYYDANGDFVLYQVDETPKTTECE